MSMTIDLGGPGGVLSVARTGAVQSLLLSAHASGRYLVNEVGEPVLLIMESAWSVANGLLQADIDVFLDAKQAQGVNSIAVMVINGTVIENPPENLYGELPYTGTMFQSSINEPYWAQMDYMVEACRQRGIIVAMVPAYTGGNPDDGVSNEVNAASEANMFAYGAFLGARYVDFDNIMWFLWGDQYISGLEPKYQALYDGIQSEDTRHTLYSAEMGNGVSTHELDFAWMTMDSLYAYETNGNFVYAEAEGCWNYLKGGTQSVPVLSFETLYEGEWSTTPERIRRQFIHAICSGCLAGFLYGNFAVYGFGWGLFQGGEDWHDHLADDGLLDLLRVWELLSTRAWHTLIHPSQQADSSFVTAGRGTFATVDWVVATRDATSGATLALCYRESGAPYTLDMSCFAGSVTARWFDIRDGSLTAATGSPFANSGTHEFNPGTEVGTNSAGDDDWLLLLEVL